jgi:propionyl-CoA carboxylase beta chain
MVDQTSHMFITGPDVIKTVTGESVEFEELGGARTHNTRSGNAHYMGSDEEDALEFVKALLSYLPSNNLSDPPVFESDPVSLEPDESLNTAIPDSANQPYDMHTIIERVVDDGEFLEVQPLFAPNLIVGFGRVEGRPVGVVANQPMQFAGTLDIDASEKAARFVRTCDAFNVPVLTFVDVPGFLPGTDQEWNGIIRRGAKLLYAYAEATVPEGHVITRKAYGGAYDVMGSKHLGADVNLAWPSRADRRHGGAGRREHPPTARSSRGSRRPAATSRPSGAGSSRTTRTPWSTRTSRRSGATWTPSSRRRAPAPRWSGHCGCSGRSGRRCQPKKHGNIPL